MNETAFHLTTSPGLTQSIHREQLIKLGHDFTFHKIRKSGLVVFWDPFRCVNLQKVQV